MTTYLKVQKDRLIGELQEDFNTAFPFLKIEFYKKAKGTAVSINNQHIHKSVCIGKAGVSDEGTLKVVDTMTVGELEHIFKDQFGAIVQVSRKSGSLWLETTMTDNWTLSQQNEHGKELSMPTTKKDDNGIDHT